MSLGCCNITLLVLGIFGLVLVVLGPILGYVVFPPIVDDEIIESVRLEEGLEQFDRWVTTPVPFSFKVYIFNVENPDDILRGSKPILKELGPYVYKQHRKKDVLNVNTETDTLEYTQNLEFEFDADASEGTENDDVTVLNVALQGVLQIGEDAASLTLNRVWNKMFQDSPSIFHTIKVKNLLFDGYKFCIPSDMVGVEYNIARSACKDVRTQAESSPTLVVDSDNAIVFSFFKHKSVNADGPYIINAGNNDVHQIGAIQSWNGVEYISSWNEIGENTCNKIRGRDSSIYPPFNNDTSEFEIFNSDICKIVKLRTKYSSSYEGIDGNVAKLETNTFTNVGNGDCYCTKGTKDLNGEYECFPEGFADMRTCTGAPVVVSFPHFLWAKDYTETVEGLLADEDEHSTFVMIEPGTGTPLQGAKRIQFNMVVRPLRDFDLTVDVTPSMFPVLWVEESVDLSDDLVEKLKDDYLSKLVALDAVTYTLLAVGIVLFIGGFGGFFFRRC
nr:sensory neuron membrane protein 2-like [Onthophagus taurus]